jgi:glucosamine-6-phosphate deaminase
MEVVIVPDAASIGELAADAVGALLDREPTAVLGLATGSSPLVVYAELARRHHAGQVSFARSRGFLLDEYVGLPAGHPQRYRSVIRRELEEQVDFAADAIAGPDGLADDLPAVCADYERATTCRTTSSPRDWAPSSRPGTSC